MYDYEYNLPCMTEIIIIIMYLIIIIIIK